MSVGDGPRTGDETRRVDQDAPFLPAPETASGPDSGGRVKTPGTGVQAARDEMVAEVARALGYAGVSPFEIEDFRIEDVADRLRRAGFRRVMVDDTTAEQVGQVIMHALAKVAGEDYDSPKAAWSEVGRAAVRALREDAQ